MRTSDQINELATALAKAQSEMKNAVFNKENPHFRSKYADLASVRDAVTPALAQNGIAVVQGTYPNTEGPALSLVTRLVHSSGQWIESAYPIFSDTAKPQAMGSALSYARRYSLSAICNIASEIDDDGNAAQENGKNGNGFPPGNPDVKYYKTDAKTPGAVKAQDNNTFYKVLEREIENLRTKSEGRNWRQMRERDLVERVGPEAMLHLSERYEERMAALP